MDPLSALGLASNIIQFVQFAAKLISESQEAYESIDGLSQRHSDLEGIAVDLLNLQQQLLKDASCRAPGAKPSAAEAQLQSLARSDVCHVQLAISDVNWGHSGQVEYRMKTSFNQLRPPASRRQRVSLRYCIIFISIDANEWEAAASVPSFPRYVRSGVRAPI